MITDTDMHLRRIAAVLLDMDGTLVDSDQAVERAWAAWADEFGVERGVALGDVHGRPADATVRRLRPDLADDDVERAAGRQLELQYDDLSDVVATPGATELLATLDRLGIPWAVVTSADHRLARARLGAAGIDAATVVTVDDITNGKPHPEGYELAADRLGVDIDRCLVVEDSDVGVAAGRAAGALTAALKGRAGDLRLGDLHQLTALLQKTFELT